MKSLGSAFGSSLASSSADRGRYVRPPQPGPLLGVGAVVLVSPLQRPESVRSSVIVLTSEVLSLSDPSGGEPGLG